MNVFARLVALFATLCGAAIGIAQQQSTPDVRVLDLEGTPYERGLKHGVELKREIAALLPLFKADIARRSGKPAETFIPEFLERTQYGETIRTAVPELLDEVRGIAAGSGQDFATMLVYQLIDEYWVQTMLQHADKCTSLAIAARDGKPTLVAQNLDIPQWMHTYPTVLRIQHSDSELQSLVVTIPGLIGAMGCNSGRVVVCVNTILQLHSRTDGLPVAFMVRGVLAQQTSDAACAFVRDTVHASGQAYTIGGPKRVDCFECSANKVVPFVPESGAERVWHTNHPVASDDFASWFVAAARGEGSSAAEFDVGCTRFPAIERGLAVAGPCGFDEIVTLLGERRHHVCNDATFACIVMSLGDRPTMRIAAGAPTPDGFTTVEFRGENGK